MHDSEGSARFRIDRRAVRHAANRASTSYDAAAEPVAQVRDELLQRLQYFRIEPRVIVDLGCGTGAGTAALRRRFPRAKLIAVDLAYSMTRQARRGQRFWRRFDCVCAEACALPFAAQSVDLIFSSLMLPYCDDPAALFAEVQRVLRPGGLLLFATLGPVTLHELRDAWAAADLSSHVSAFAEMAQLGAAIARAGLAEPVMDRDLLLTHHPRVEDLLHALHAGGACHYAADRRRSLTGPGRLRAMRANYELLRTPAGIPASWELIYGAAFAGRSHPRLAHGEIDGPADGAADETIVPLSAVRMRPRSPP